MSAQGLAKGLARSLARGVAGVGAAAATPSLPSGAIGVWYADQHANARVPNAVAETQPKASLLTAPRRLYNNATFWNKASITVTDNYAESNDGVTGGASRLVASSAAGYIWRSRTLAAGTYTLGVWVRSNTGSNQNFRMQFFTASLSTTKTATSSWQRFSFTGTVTSGTQLLIPIRTENDTASLDVVFSDCDLYSGSEDLGANTLAGHLDLGISGTGVPAYASGELTLTSSYGTVQFPTTKTVSQFTVCCAVSKVAAGTAFQSFLSSIASFTGFSAYLEISAAAARGSGSTAYLGSYGAGFWRLLNSGYHVITQRYDGTKYSTFIDDVLLYQTVASFSSLDLKDMWLGTVNDTSFTSGYKFACGGMWDSALTDEQVRSVVNVFSDRMAQSSLSLSPFGKVLISEGDSITAGQLANPYSNLFGSNASPAIVGRNLAVGSAKLANFSGNSVLERAPVADAVIPSDKNSRMFVYSVLIGRNDGPTWGTAAAYAQSVADVLYARKTAGYDKTVICTLLPTSTASGGSTFNPWRNNVNAIWQDSGFRASNAIDGIADFAANATIGVDAAADNATYYPDGVHPGSNGYAIMEPIYRATINAL